MILQDSLSDDYTLKTNENENQILTQTKTKQIM